MFRLFWNTFHLHIIITAIVLLNMDISEGIDDHEWFSLNVTMQNYNSNKEDEIIFMQYKLPDEELTIRKIVYHILTRYSIVHVVGYTPIASMATVHHMNLVACERPASQEIFWSGGMPCNVGASMLLYGWDRDALPFRLPADVGILIGKNTPYKYVVVNIHYLPIVKNDSSGSQIIVGRKRPRHLAGVMSGGTTLITLPPKSYNITAPFSCQYQGQKLSIFAIGVHAHRWGTFRYPSTSNNRFRLACFFHLKAHVNSLYRLRGLNLTLIAKVNPQQSHQSYLLSTPIEIIAGDYIIGQCVYDNIGDRVEIFYDDSLRHDDEMCNVMAGYSYAFSDTSDKKVSVPFEDCWGDSFPDLSFLIPANSLTLPSNQTTVDSIAPLVFVSNNTTNKTMLDKHLKTIIIYFTTGASLYLFACIIYLTISWYQHSNYREKRLCCCLNVSYEHFWKRNDGFDRLKTYSDEEEEEELV